eukprot:TRINITY_DN14230_c0_g1_i1.p2 TRINITY_DN14230_c0_g1~~TRINITY_DN14230_c0_g1_i1.p2  ORF type:complete len:100 (+),score=28.60 TRINITY_DN14230_c0_g1_i1:35-334(+)
MGDRRAVLRQLEREDHALRKASELRPAIRRQLEANQRVRADHERQLSKQQAEQRQQQETHQLTFARAQQIAMASWTPFSVQESHEGNLLIPTLPVAARD